MIKVASAVLIGFLVVPLAGFSLVMGLAGTSQAGGPQLPGTVRTPNQTNQPGLEAALYAESMIGVPYLYGGSSPSGFDCSGLAWAAYRQTTVAFARMGAQDEFKATPQVPQGDPLEPGDLVFFANSTLSIQHVGIFIGYLTSGSSTGLMIDAPHSGADVRYDEFGTNYLDSWGDEYYVGATRPGG